MASPYTNLTECIEYHHSDENPNGCDTDEYIDDMDPFLDRLIKPMHPSIQPFLRGEKDLNHILFDMDDRFNKQTDIIKDLTAIIDEQNKRIKLLEEKLLDE